jgi:hypothetical protein
MNEKETHTTGIDYSQDEIAAKHDHKGHLEHDDPPRNKSVALNIVDNPLKVGLVPARSPLCLCIAY